VVFDILHFAVNHFGIEPQEFQEFREDSMAGFNVLGHLATRRCECEPAIPFIIHKTPARKPSDHVGNRRGAEVQTRGKIRDPSVALLFDELLDPL
jgi:hypothetical protein